MHNDKRFLQIKASAGSGKTYTLTHRFLHLLAHAEKTEERRFSDFDRANFAKPALTDPSITKPIQDHVPPYLWTDILAMTFTNSAATEMKERILSELKKLALAGANNVGLDYSDDEYSYEKNSSDTLNLFDSNYNSDNLDNLSSDQKHHTTTPQGQLSPQQAAKWVDCIIRRYGSLNIRTIDSLLTMLVRLSALDLRLPPDFEPAFDTKAFFTPLMDAVLEDARHKSHPLHTTLNDACKSILLYKGDNGHLGFTAGKSLHNALHEFVDWHLQNDEPLPSVQSADLQELLHAFYDTVRLGAEILLEIVNKEGLAVNANAIKGFEACKNMQRGDTIKISAYVERPCLQAVLNKKSKEPSQEAQEAFLFLRERAAELKKNGPLLRKVLVELPLVHLVQEIVRRQEAHQLREGKVPANLLPKLASQAVNGEYGAPVAFCRMGSRLARVFIDEFQDTSRDQWAVIQALGLETLSQGGALTLIGDVKQAIYGWRGGDSSLFDEAFANQELKNVSDTGEENLFTNWRSAASIVQHNNEVFGVLAHEEHARTILRGMLPQETPCDVFDDAVASVTKAFTGTEQLVAECHKNTEGYVEIHHIEREATDEVNEALREQIKILFAENLAKRHPWRDIAVLVRGNTQAKEVATWLMSWGIPVVTSNSLRLADHPIICQTLAMLRFVDYPRDDIAFWECVTGQELFVAVSGYSRQYFEDWLAKQKSAGRKGPLFTMFRADFPQLWDACFAPFYSRAGLMSAYDTVREIFYRYEVFERYDHEAGFLRRFLEVVYNAEGQGYVSLSTFLDFWKKEAGEEKVPMPEGMDAVKVMTMHKSKGLQFPVVIIPYHQAGERHHSKLVYANVCNHNVVLQSCKELGEVHYQAQADEAREKLHLLYVAWTRAEHELYAFVTTTVKRSSKFSNAILDLVEISSKEHDNATENIADNPEALSRIICQRGQKKDTTCTKEEQHETYESQVLESDKDVCAVDNAHEAQNVSPNTSLDLSIGFSPSFSPDQSHASQPVLENTWRPMQWLPRLKIFRNALQDVEFNERQRGMLVHSCLEQLRLGEQSSSDYPIYNDNLHKDGLVGQNQFGKVQLTKNTADQVRTAVQNAMRAFRLPIPEPDKMEVELIHILSWFASIPEAPYWLAHGTPEQAILDSYGNRHRVDLLVDSHKDDEHEHLMDESPEHLIDENREWLVIEYKTGQASPDHAAQVRRYLNLLTAMQDTSHGQNYSCRGVIVYLDLQRLVYVDSKNDNMANDSMQNGDIQNDNMNSDTVNKNSEAHV